jgi:hypothetical protein
MRRGACELGGVGGVLTVLLRAFEFGLEPLAAGGLPPLDPRTGVQTPTVAAIHALQDATFPSLHCPSDATGKIGTACLSTNAIPTYSPIM